MTGQVGGSTVIAKEHENLQRELASARRVKNALFIWLLWNNKLKNASKPVQNSPVPGEDNMACGYYNTTRKKMLPR